MRKLNKGHNNICNRFNQKKQNAVQTYNFNMSTEVSSDPYEMKLYQMFQSCETQHCGLLDETALRKLCTLLELRDKGASLISNLATNGGLKLGVSFKQFKEALLHFLGTEFDGSTITAASDSIVFNKERSLVITNDVDTNYIESPPESSDREVSPKLVVGTKKYGRRSRSHLNTITMNELSVTDSDNTDEEQRRLNDHEKSSLHVQRSASQTDIPGCRSLRPKQLSGNKLKRCSSLPARKNLQQANKLNASKALKKPNAQLQQQQQHTSSAESLDTATTPTQLETLSSQSIVEIWTHASIVNGRGMLTALGFDEDEVNVLQLIKVMEEELRALDDDSQSNMLRALVALQSVELSTIRQAYRQLHDENIKLRADNKEANRRVSLLAVEIDERHASLEDNSKKQIQSLEQRHAIVVRELTARIANDRDNWTNLSARLEAQIKCLEQEEIKLKTELELIRCENIELEKEHQKAQKQITELLEQNIQLNNELANNETTKPGDETNTSIGKTTDDDVLQLVEKISSLQMENSQLRDKNDELVVEVESLQHELLRSKSKVKKAGLSNNAIDLDDTSNCDEVEQSISATATKRRGDSPSKTRITEESPRLGKLRKCGDDSCASEHSDTSGEWMALNSELKRSNVGQEDVRVLKQKIMNLEQQLQSTKPVGSITATSGSGPTSDDRCKELESSLEQMQRAYEDCEDYWQSKLSEERQLFEKERQIYEDEQQESDKKFTELMEKVREYEEQFSKDGRLSPIEERDTLEQQYADLEVEAAEVRENSIRMLDEKAKQIDALQNEIEDLRLRLGESVEILTGACELNTDAAAQLNAETALSPASSPISYLWHQSTIQEPAKNFVSSVNVDTVSSMIALRSPSKQANRINLTTSETTLFSTPPVDGSISSAAGSIVAPIQKPTRSKSPEQIHSEGEIADCETSSTSSNKSFDTQSVLSTRSATLATKTTSANSMKDELKRLKFFELSLKEQIKDLSLQRDGLVMELQQLQEARPVLEKAYARTAHPTLMQRVNQLELKNRHLQNVIKQQQQYTESLMQQSWRQHQGELNDLHGRLEAQSIMLAEQTQRLQNADILVKDLYVENSHLTATVQRLEQQRARVNLIHQQQQQQQPTRLIGASLSGLPGMP